METPCDFCELEEPTCPVCCRGMGPAPVAVMVAERPQARRKAARPSGPSLFDLGPEPTENPAHDLGAVYLAQPAFRGLGGMREMYDALGILATSERADIVLIRSHVAYHTSDAEAARVTIKPSRGHSYRITGGRADLCPCVVRIANPYDHREGVTGWK